MLSNPYLPSPQQADAWAQGYVRGFLDTSSTEPAEPLDDVALEAFNAGVQAGSDAQANGIAFDQPCLAALEEHGPGHEAGMAINGAEIAHGLWELRHLKSLAAGIAGLLVAFIELACTLPVHTLPPEEVLPSLGQPLVDELAGMGFDSAEFYVGAGMDPGATDCEILMTPMFGSEEQAVSAAEALGRSEWVVVSWRTDQSNSFRVVR